MPPAPSTRTPSLAALAGGGVGVLGGLIGLGGAEFRLPVLVRLFGYELKVAVLLNLAVSLITVVSALAARLTSGARSGDLIGRLDIVAAMAVGSMVGAHRGATWLATVSEPGLHRAVQMLLLLIGVLLLVESSLSSLWSAPAPPPLVRIAAGQQAHGQRG